MGKIHIQKIVREELSHLTEEQKRKILHDLDESKVTPARVSKAFTKVAEISKLMITNLEKYKSAKSSGDENAIAKHTKIAGDLTKKKKAAESEANSLIAQLDRDVELSLEGIKEIVSEEYDKLNESMIGIKTKANFKPLQLKGALERAGIKGYQMNRLSWSLTALKIDKKYFKDAKKIIDGLGLSVMTAKESVNEALARGLKPLLTIGTKITKKVGENALLKLSDKFDRLDDEQADDVASHLNLAIELMQDGYPGDATKKLKQFNKACKDALSGKSIKSAFEGVNEANRGKVFKAARKGSYPAVIVVVQNGKVIHQEPVSTPEVAPATFNVMQEKYPKALLHLEDRTGKRLFSESVVNEAEDYKYKKYVTQAFDKISDAMFTFRNAMGVKQLGQANPKLKKRIEAMQTEIFALRRDMKSEGLTESVVSVPAKFDDEVFKVPPSKMNRDHVLKVAKKYKVDPKLAIQYVNQVGRLKLKEDKLDEMDINDPILISIRARKQMLAKDKAAPKTKKISTKQYYKLMDAEIDLINQMKDATEEYEQLDSDMNAEAGQKGADWTDADANRYGGDLNTLQTKIEKLAKQKLAVKKQIMNYRIN